MEATRNLCAQIPISLHDKVREEKEALGLSLNEYVTKILKEYYEGGKTNMAQTKSHTVTPSPGHDDRGLNLSPEDITADSKS